jgi:hypothetical protein
LTLGGYGNANSIMAVSFLSVTSGQEHADDLYNE